MCIRSHSPRSVSILSVAFEMNFFFLLFTGHTCSCLLRALLWKLHINMMSNNIVSPPIWHNENGKKKEKKKTIQQNHYTVTMVYCLKIDIFFIPKANNSIVFGLTFNDRTIVTWLISRRVIWHITYNFIYLLMIPAEIMSAKVIVMVMWKILLIALLPIAEFSLYFILINFKYIAIVVCRYFFGYLFSNCFSNFLRKKTQTI